MLRSPVFLGTTLLLTAVIFSSVVTGELVEGRLPSVRSTEQPSVSFNQNYIEKVLSIQLDLDNPLLVFDYVFARLPDTVTVYPTENYYYFRFYANSQAMWGNIRLDADDRDEGLLSFGYFGAHNKPEQPEDLDYSGTFKQLGVSDGVVVAKEDSLRYVVAYKGKTVIFNLHDVPQTLPEGFQLLENDKFLARTFDESGFQFILLYDESQPQFRFVLDETAPLPDVLYELGPGLLAGRLSGFVFYTDTMGQKVLVGVDANNVRRNNYYDGPFDQLADNFVEGKELQEAMEAAYPYVRGRINERGSFLDSKGRRLDSRLALTPYRTYDTLESMRQMLAMCGKDTVERNLVFCLTRDYKQDVPGPEE